MRFAILGSLRVTSDGREIALGGAKQRALLAMLLLSANERVSRDRLMEGLWGERLPPSADHTLDGYISRLRKAIGHDRIERMPGGYTLRVEPDELDVQTFEGLVREGHDRVADGDPAVGVAVLAQALAVWRGPALGDLLDEPFAPREAAQLEERRLAVIEERVDAELEAGAGQQLVPELVALSHEHPFRERLLAALMLALYRVGRQAAALEVYRAARRRFAEELGIEPGPRLARLERSILEHDPTLLVHDHAASAGGGRHPRRWVVVAAAVVALAAAGGGVAFLRPNASAHAPAGSADGNELVRLAASGRAAAAFQLAGTPASVAFGDGSLWIADTSGNELLRADPRSGAVTDRIPLPAQPGGIAVGGGSVWVAATGGATIMRVDGRTHGVTQLIRLASTPAGLAFGANSLWVGDPADEAVLRVDPASGDPEQTVTVGVQPAAIAVADGRIWIAGYDTGSLVEVEPRTGSLVASVHVGQGPAALAFASGSLWVANRLDGTVSQIDPRAAQVIQTLPTGSTPIALAAAGDSVWVADEFSRSVTRLDATRGTIRSRTPLAAQPVAIAAATVASSRKPLVWLATIPQARRRGGTLVLLDTRRFLSIDPQVDYEATPPGFLGLVNDTLVSFDHATGTDGFQLVPDLALRLPQATDGGRTYVFELRPGLHYSDGRRVRASDFQRSMTRLFRVHSPGTSFFSVLVGGDACVARPTSCRLSGGVVADDVSRTVTFHLTAPDPDFLFKLALGFVVPIPPGTPMHEVRSHPIVGTGPYEFAEVGAKRFTFVRNPRFSEWSHAAQPDGNPDHIVWRFGLTSDEEIRAVAAGRADWTGDFPSDLATVVRRYPAELHGNVFPTAYFAQLDTRRPPFNDVRVRRALNYAVDRAKVVGLSGGPTLNAPLCQVIPAGLPGYHRYCPYTRDPGASGRWTAPNFPRAAALVAASGTRGESVTVWSVSDNGSPEPAAPYLAGVLRRLGYRAKARVITTQQFATLPPKAVSRMQALLVTFGPDYPSASEIYSLFLACEGQWTHHLFCDRRLDREAARAESLRLSAPRRSEELWAKIDHVLVERAVTVPLTTQRILDFVSRRLRDYEFSPVYHFLPAQASVR